MYRVGVVPPPPRRRDGFSGDGDASVAAVVGEGVDDVTLGAFLREELLVKQFGDGVGEFLGVEGGEGDGHVAGGEGIAGDAGMPEELGGERTDKDGAGFGGGLFRQVRLNLATPEWVREDGEWPVRFDATAENPGAL